MFQVTPIVLILLATTMVNALVVHFSLKRTSDAASRYFSGAMVCITFWTLASALDYAAVETWMKVFFATLEAWGYLGALYLFALFSISFAGRSEWLDRKWFKVGLALPLVFSFLLVSTNGLHGWVWSELIRLENNLAVFVHGAGYAGVMVSSYLVLFIIIAALWDAARQGATIRRQQARLLLVGPLFTMASNVFYHTMPFFAPGVDWTSVLFSITGVWFLWVLRSTRLFDLAPIARDTIFEGLGDGMIVVDMQNRIVDINQPAAKLMEAAVSSLLGNNLAEIRPFSRLVSAPPVGHITKTELQLGGEHSRYYDVLICPLRKKDQEMIGRLLMFRDITNRKENELRLLQLTQAVEQSPVSVMITDTMGNIEYVNPYFTLLTGFVEYEVLGKKTSIMKSGLTPESVYKEMWQTIQSGKTWEGEFLNRKKNRELYWEHVVISPVVDMEGKIINYIAVKSDITDRKLADDALRQANEQLENQLEEIEALQATLREQSIRDPLTQLYNRRFLLETFTQELELAEATGKPFSILLLDIDLFKEINDQYGHAAGDECLVWLANLLRQQCRELDILCRYGGEEFLLVLPDTPIENAVPYADRLRERVGKQPIELGARKLAITISCGVSAYPNHGKTAQEIINKADAALYTSKRNGRNQVTAWEEGAMQLMLHHPGT